MAHLFTWLNQNWFTLIQTLGIIGSLLLTTAALRRDTGARRLGDFLTLAGHHRELWSEIHRNPELRRIFSPEVDLLAHPITPAEQEFLNLVIVHFHTGWHLAKQGAVHSLDVIATDARSFFALPVPRAVWEATRECRDPEFQRFIDQALGKKSA